MIRFEPSGSGDKFSSNNGQNQPPIRPPARTATYFIVNGWFDSVLFEHAIRSTYGFPIVSLAACFSNPLTGYDKSRCNRIPDAGPWAPSAVRRPFIDIHALKISI